MSRRLLPPTIYREDAPSRETSMTEEVDQEDIDTVWPMHEAVMALHDEGFDTYDIQTLLNWEFGVPSEDAIEHVIREVEAEERKEWLRPSPKTRRCAWCHGPMPEGLRADALYCKDTCKWAAKKARYRARKVEAGRQSRSSG